MSGPANGVALIKIVPSNLLVVKLRIPRIVTVRQLIVVLFRIYL